MSILLSSQSQQRMRCVVMGLDGLPLEMAHSLGDQFPGIARIAEKATTVRAEIPELSPVNWTSFFTAEGPEKHGVFGFAQMDPVSYTPSITNSTHIATPTIFDHLGQHGLISRIINLPNTYPAHPIRGMLIAGFVAHELQKAVYPPFLADQLKQKNYHLEADTTRGASDPEYLFQELEKTLSSRLAALEMLWPDLAWDLFVLVFTETDRLFHFFYPAVQDSAHPLHHRCMTFFKQWDKAIQVLLHKYDALPEPKRLIVLADHGFTDLRTEVDVNAVLRQEGWLKQPTLPDNEWDSESIGRESLAFALDPGRIYLHTQERFSRSTVYRHEAEKILPQIRHVLENLTYCGQQVMENILDAKQLYPGATGAQLPDLVCQARPGFDLKAKFNRRDIFSMHGRYGTHTVDGAIFFDSHGSKPARMRDIGRVILDYFGISL